MHSHWQKQGTEPLFPNLVWSRPETKATAGKLLIIGGTGQSFAGAAEAYQQAEKAGIGSVHVLLPHSLERTVGKLFPEAEFVPATPSGSFAVSALAELLAASTWADGVLVTADTGNNSETARLFETFLTTHQHTSSSSVSSRAKSRDLLRNQEDFSASPLGSGYGRNDRKGRLFQMTLCGDIIDSFTAHPSVILDRSETTLVLTFDQLQRLAIAAHHTEAFTSDMGLLMLVERLGTFNKSHAAHLVVIYQDTIVVTADGHISTTERGDHPTPNTLAPHAATWWLQTPTDPYAALTTAMYKHEQYAL